MREKEASTTIIYIRHGKTNFPMDRIYCDDQEHPDLNPQGIEQARKTAQLLKSINIDAVYSSPTRRCLQTADIIVPQFKNAIVQLQELKERHFGVWEGLYFDEIEKKFPQARQLKYRQKQPCLKTRESCCSKTKRSRALLP